MELLFLYISILCIGCTQQDQHLVFNWGIEYTHGRIYLNYYAVSAEASGKVLYKIQCDQYFSTSCTP